MNLWKSCNIASGEKTKEASVERHQCWRREINQECPTSNVCTLRTKDVICTRNSSVHKHPGNRRYTVLIQMYYEAYQSSTLREDKSRITRQVIQAVCDYGGRFVKYDENTGTYQEIDSDAKREKVSHALRTAVDPAKRQRRHKRINKKLHSKGDVRNCQQSITENNNDVCSSLSFPLYGKEECNPLAMRNRVITDDSARSMVSCDRDERLTRVQETSQERDMIVGVPSLAIWSSEYQQSASTMTQENTPCLSSVDNTQTVHRKAAHLEDNQHTIGCGCCMGFEPVSYSELLEREKSRQEIKTHQLEEQILIQKLCSEIQDQSTSIKGNQSSVVAPPSTFKNPFEPTHISPFSRSTMPEDDPEDMLMAWANEIVF